MSTNLRRLLEEQRSLMDREPKREEPSPASKYRASSWTPLSEISSASSIKKSSDVVHPPSTSQKHLPRIATASLSATIGSTTLTPVSSSSTQKTPLLETAEKRTALLTTGITTTALRRMGPNLLCQPGLRDALSVALGYMRNPSNFRQCCRFTVECWDHAVYLEGYLPCPNRNLATWLAELPWEQRKHVQVGWESAPRGPFTFLSNSPSKASDFEILETVGTGSFSRVKLCRLKLQGHKEKGNYFAMKILNKTDILKMKQVQHTIAERDIMTKLNHPFIANMPWSFQDERSLYMILEYVIGGEMFTHLRSAGRLPNDVAKFYLAEIILAIEHMHHKHIIYRDIKPENLILDSKGHVKIVDFGFAKDLKGSDRTFTLCGTPEYLAPEIIQSKGHGKPVDWWTLGVLLYEFLCGYPPFFDDSPFKVYEKILEGKIKFPNWIDPRARDLLKGFLRTDPAKRLGTLGNGVADLKNHPYFHGANWQRLFDRHYPAPIPIKVKGPGDTSHFERYDADTGDSKALLPSQQAEFKNF